ncbi:MAG: hypothetical protein IIA50_03710, partial [Bacteroidetes bacterium]|nr:hypothetical protein [Bacteroidota bacterium]
MKKSLLAGLAAAIILTFQGCASLFSGRTTPETDAFLQAEAVRSIEEFVQRCASSDCGFRIDPGSRVDSVFVSRANRTVDVHFNPAFAQIPFRERNVGQIRDQVASLLGPRFADYTIDLRA